MAAPAEPDAMPPIPTDVAPFEGVPEQHPALAAFDSVLDRVKTLQRDALVGINRVRGATDPAQRAVAAQAVRDSYLQLEATFDGDPYRNGMSLVRAGQTMGTDPRWVRLFGEGGQLGVILRTQDSLRQFINEGTSGAPGAPSSTAPAAPTTESDDDKRRDGGVAALRVIETRLDQITVRLSDTTLTAGERQAFEAERTNLLRQKTNITGSR